MISRNKQREYLKALQALERQATGGLYDELEGLIEAFISAAAEDERSPFREQITELINTRLKLVNPEIKQLAVETFNSLALDIKAQEIKGIEGYATPLVAVDRTVRSAAEKLFCDTPDREGYVGRVRDFVSREVRRTAAENMMEAVEVSNGRRRGQDLRFARVPQGRETCMFCIMLASRGFVYHSRYKAGELNHYHSHCDCLILPGYKDQTEYEGYDPDKLQDRFKKVESSLEYIATYDNYRGYVTEKKKEGIGEKDIINFSEWKLKQTLKEMRCRDTDWVNGGETPPVALHEITSEDVKKHELATAEKLREYGIQCTFRKDSRKVKSTKGDWYETRGLADCVNGIELKSIRSTNNKKRIKKAVQDGKVKEGCKTIIIDNLKLPKAIEIEAIGVLTKYLGERPDIKQGIYLLDIEDKLLRLN